MNDINPFLEIARLVAASIAGALSGALAAHLFTASREKASGKTSRKRDFLAFMQAWRVEVERPYLVIGGFERRPSAFLDVISEFRAAAEMIRGDFTAKQRTRFDELVSIVDKCDCHNYAKTVERIDEVIAHVEAA